MKQLGMKENEVVGHSLVSKSIVNAQEKLERKAVAEKHATSQDEWFLKNIGPRK
jgi:preprotein translocase subunit SecA